MTVRRSRAEADLDDLIPTFVATPADIHLAEQANIETATMWAFGRRRVCTPERLLTIEFADRIHHRMFGDVWRSAGTWSTRTTTSGIKPREIGAHLDELFDELRRRLEHGAGTPADLAIRLHDGLLAVCAYRHGNARHARLMADVYLHLVGAPPIDWNEVRSTTSEPTRAARERKISALQEALDKAAKPDPKQLQAALDRAMKPHK